ncbi:molecular chaperone [Pseudomonas sp. 8O]|uniref:fimbrial biogenesis chaperone n=1 Tax=Pseudomonas sp. 8O TaxID=2653165 RepID=UPI0012F3AD74|nr:molecular chaperone [Pseudomonas sp. 8O]VXC35904.1 conserved exported hypothetical protein [Pseudomonas sp. 8O]
MKGVLTFALGLLLTTAMATSPVQAASVDSSTAPPVQQPHTGLSFSQLRIVYPAHASKGVSLKIHNTSDGAYLVQSWVRPVSPETGSVDLTWAGKPKMPFIVTPPLSRLEAHSEHVLRIRYTGQALPQDRESIFFVSLRALPAQPPTPDADRVVMTVVTNLKLFYRPAGLAEEAITNASRQLRFRREGNQLIAINPTPYWLTFASLSLGHFTYGTADLRLMVPPMAEQHYAIPSAAERDASVKWRLIDEGNWETPESQQAL